MPLPAKPSIESLLKNRQVWRASGIRDLRQETAVTTGYKALDQLLADSGWPTQGLTEILHNHQGMGELRLLMPAMAQLSQKPNRWVLLVSPPYIPYAPALSQAGIDLTRLLIVKPESTADQQWVLEQALASNSCSMVMAWPKQASHKQLRRLQVASKSGDCLGILYRHSQVAALPSPAELRIQISHEANRSALSDRSVVNLQILKRRGGWPTDTLQLELNDSLTQLTPDFSELNAKRWKQTESELVFVDTNPMSSTYRLQ